MAAANLQGKSEAKRSSDITIVAGGGVRFAAHKLVLFSFPGFQRVADADTDLFHLPETAPVVCRMLQWMYGHERAGFAGSSRIEIALAQLIELGSAAEKVDTSHWCHLRQHDANGGTEPA